SAATNAANVTIEKGHGRIEAREYQVLPADNVASQFPEWKGVKTLGVAIGYRLEKSGKQSLDYRYYLSSAELDTAALRCRRARALAYREQSALGVRRGDG